jgi:FkbM family methyltransferase
MHRVVKRIVHKGALFAGVQVGRFPSVDSLQGHLRSFFRLTGINCVIDVGAHTGEYFETLSQIGYGGRVVSFEPVKANYAVLARKAGRDKRWLIRNLALGSDEGVKEINIYQGTVFNSFLQSSEYAAARWGDQVERTTSERVQVTRLDKVFADCVSGIDCPRIFLKMDTQGWDIEVLRGASGIMDQLVGIQSELSAQHCYDGMIPYTKALEHYTALGFQITGMFPVARDKDKLRVVEFDCVMLRHGDAQSGPV